MIRPLTCVCMLLAAGSGLYLYQTKHRAQLLDREIARTLKQTDQARDRIGALKGEWALLSEPERLNELAGQHLALKTLAPTQFVAMTDLAARLPAPLPPGATMPPLDDPAPNPVLAAKPIVAAPRLAERAPERAPERLAEKPVQMAALPQPAVPPPAPAPRPAPKAAPAPAAIPAAAPPAPPHAPPPPTPPMPMAPRILAPVMNVSAGQIPPHPASGVGESVARAARLREQAAQAAPAAAPPPAYTSPAYTTPAYTTPQYGSAQYGSALGGAARVALPAPVPFGAGQR